VIRRLKPHAIARLWRADVPRPADVLNLIETGDARSYRRYGLLVAPVLLAVGGRPVWMGRREHIVAGAPAADKLLIVRYPSHRRFLAMTLSPWWQAINPLRERGVTRFEAAFFHASTSERGLRHRRSVLGVGFDGDLDLLVDAIGPAPLVYAARRTARLDEILSDLRPTDPHPPRHHQLACFAVGPGWVPSGALPDGCDAAVYARESPIR
jgi:uncharacterized protein (DUF1330 family)